MKGDKMNDLMIFKNAEFGKVRTMNINNEPWFCLLDICKALEIKNISQLKTRLNGDGVIINEVIDNVGRKQNANFVNEANLYKVIFQSRKASANRFIDWVRETVENMKREANKRGFEVFGRIKLRDMKTGKIYR